MKKESKKNNFLKKETTLKKELIAFAIIIAIVVIIYILWYIEPHTIIQRGGRVSDYSKYGEYASVVKFVDFYNEQIFPILRIICIVLGIISLIIGIIKSIYIKGPSSAKVLFFFRRIITAYYIVIIPAILYLMILAVTGIRINQCWCGPDFVKIISNS